MNSLYAPFSLSEVAGKEKALETGTGNFPFKTRDDAKKEITVWYHKPKSFSDTSRFVFVMHGMKRNSESYIKPWIPYADDWQFLVLAPQFSKKYYPGCYGYNLGNMRSSAGKINPERSWGFTVIEELFDYVKSRMNVKASNYSIYGHSAGAQFVHRMVMFKRHARIRFAIAANAGWYTMPTDTIDFPYGLKNSGTDVKEVSNSFGKSLILLFGTQDTGDKHLRKAEEAMAQGRNRYERGLKFYETAKTSAEKQKISLNWMRKEVCRVGHSNSKMAPFAACLLHAYLSTDHTQSRGAPDRQ